MTHALFSFIPSVVLSSIRVGVAFASMPSPFGSVTPMKIRATLGIMIGFCLVYTTGLETAVVDPSPASLMVAGFGEMLAGTVIGLTVRMTLAVVEVAGTFIGFTMGLGFGSTIDPAFGESSTPLSRALTSFGILIFFVLKGHYIVLGALNASFDTAPLGNAFGILLQQSVLDIGKDMLAHGLRIASPVMATMFLIQLGLGLLSRSAPRVQLLILSFAIAVTSGLLMVMLSMPSMGIAISHTVTSFHTSLVRLVGGF